MSKSSGNGTGSGSAAAAVAAAAVPGGDHIHRCLAAVDGSVQAIKAFDQAMRMCDELFVVGVVRARIPEYEVFVPDPVTAAPRMRDEMEAVHLLQHQHVDKVLADCRNRAETASFAGTLTTEKLEGDPRDVLIEYATAHKVDTIFTGKRGLGKVAKLLLGSTSDHLLRHAPMAIYVQP